MHVWEEAEDSDVLPATAFHSLPGNVHLSLLCFLHCRKDDAHYSTCTKCQERILHRVSRSSRPQHTVSVSLCIASWQRAFKKSVACYLVSSKIAVTPKQPHTPLGLISGLEVPKFSQTKKQPFFFKNGCFLLWQQDFSLLPPRYEKFTSCAAFINLHFLCTQNRVLIQKVSFIRVELLNMKIHLRQDSMIFCS